MNEMHEELKRKIENAIYANIGSAYVPSAAQTVIDELQLSAKRFPSEDGTTVFVDGMWSE